MTLQEAKENIGNQFKVEYPGSGLLHKWDVLKSVSDDGFIEGEFSSGHCSNFRLKNSVPVQLRKQQDNSIFNNVENFRTVEQR